MDDFVESAEPDMEKFQSSRLVLFLEVAIQLFACGTLYRDPSPILAKLVQDLQGITSLSCNLQSQTLSMAKETKRVEFC